MPFETRVDHPATADDRSDARSKRVSVKIGRVAVGASGFLRTPVRERGRRRAHRCALRNTVEFFELYERYDVARFDHISKIQLFFLSFFFKDINIQF